MTDRTCPPPPHPGQQHMSEEPNNGHLCTIFANVLQLRKKMCYNPKGQTQIQHCHFPDATAAVSMNCKTDISTEGG